MRGILYIVFFFSGTLLFAQDLIVMKNGKRLSCRIIYVDSASIYFRTPPSKTENVVATKEVQQYIWHSARNASDTLKRKQKHDLYFVQVEGGGNFPISDFANKDVEDIKSGLALNGTLLQARIGLNIGANFGINAGLIYAVNKLDGEQVNSYYTRVFRTSFTHSAGKWISSGFEGGIFINIPFTSSGDFNAQLFLNAGSCKHTLPHLELISKNFYVKQSQAITRSIIFHPSLSVSYRLNEYVSVFSRAHYFYSKPYFTDVLITNGFTNAKIEYEQKITWLAISGGLTLHVGR